MTRKSFVLTNLKASDSTDLLENQATHSLSEKDLKKIRGGFSMSEGWQCRFAIPEPRYEFIDGKFVDVNPCSIFNREDR